MATEMAVMASNGKWSRIAVAEMGGHHVYQNIREYFQAELKTSTGEFMLDRITFIPGADYEEVKKLAAKEGIFLLLDCGSCWQQFEAVAHLCDRRLLLCRLVPWRMERFYTFLRQVKEVDFHSILITGGKAYRKEFRKKDKEKMVLFKEAEDSFCVPQERLRELYRIAGL